jgi:hypothetical protein
MLSMVALCRALTTEQMNRLFFQPKAVVNREGRVVRAARSDPAKVSEHCRRRLRRLFDDGYLYRSEQARTLTEGKPFVYTLAPKGAKYLRQFSDVPEEFLSVARAEPTSAAFLTHLLTINDFRVQVILACERHGVALAEWRDERELWQAHGKEKMVVFLQGIRTETAIIPDGFFIIQTPERRFNHFLEVDLSTETARASAAKSRDFARKIATYIEFFKQPSPELLSLYEQKYGTRGGRVLIVTTSEGRLRTLKALVEEVGGNERYWLTTFERIGQGGVLLTPIWSVAGQEEQEILIFSDD